MNIAIVSFKDIDAYEGISGLLDYYEEEDVTLLVPILKPLPTFFGSVIKAAKEQSAKITFFFVNTEGYDQFLKYGDDLVITDAPIKESLRTLTSNDTLGIVWDDSTPAHFVIHSVEDLAIDAWDITDGFEPLDTEDFDINLDNDVIHEELVATMGKFVDLLATFVANTVMDSLGEAVAQHLLMSADEMDKKDFNPFEDLG
jgi:hypothetical protein